MSRIPAAVVAEVHERAQDFCEACGSVAPPSGKMDLHHRLPLSAGGLNVAVNLLLVHHLCHVVSPWAIHQNPARSYRLGHLVRRGFDPADVPWMTEPRLASLRA